uniref:Actin-related protein 4 n=1 Tax=Auxenochlorella protothecoides TaxID=3075 RepID=A0A1D2A4J3_AUXPR
MYGGDEVNAVVVDLGSFTVKVGYAGEDTPKHVFPSALGSIDSPPNGDAMEVDGVGPSGRTFKVGTASLAVPQDGLEVISPFSEAGVLEDWDALEALYNHAFKDQLRLDLKEHPLMLGEPSNTPRPVREKQVELLFERYDTPAVFLAKNAVLSAFSTGRQTALVVDAGHAQTMVAAVHDGYVLQKSVIRSPLGGALLTRCLMHSVQSGGTRIHPRFDFQRVETVPGQFEVKYEARKYRGPDGELHAVTATDSYRRHTVLSIAQDLKDAVCRVSDGPFDPEENANIPQVTYELPDGQEIQVGADRFAVPEALFNPGLLARYGAEGAPDDAAPAPAPLQAAVNECVARCDVDARRELYANALLTGGTAGFASLRERLEREVTEAAPALARVKLVSPSNPVERRYSVWIGGSVLASLGSFQQMWMSKAEYAEYGPGLIHKKAP